MREKERAERDRKCVRKRGKGRQRYKRWRTEEKESIVPNMLLASEDIKQKQTNRKGEADREERGTEKGRERER